MNSVTIAYPFELLTPEAKLLNHQNWKTYSEEDRDSLRNLTQWINNKILNTCTKYMQQDSYWILTESINSFLNNYRSLVRNYESNNLNSVAIRCKLFATLWNKVLKLVTETCKILLHLKDDKRILHIHHYMNMLKY